MSFIDASYFVGELEIPNTADQPVTERIDWFIQKYEPIFLQHLLGYPLYKAFVQGVTVTPPATPDARWLNLLYGAEYTDWQGYLQKWRGIIVTDMPVYNLSGEVSYRKPEYLQAGVTPGFPVNVNTVTFDGTNNTPDLRGWTPIITRSVPMTPDEDYSWDSATGTWTLLALNDKTGINERFKFEFELRTDSVLSTGLVNNESCIANFVYRKYREATGTQYTGIGETLTKAENADNISPRKKMARAWNEMRRIVRECLDYLQQNSDTYPEWTNNNKMDALKYFGFMNPIF